MANELCFIINNIELRMEQILVEFDDVPIFYLCRGNQQLYLVLRKDMDAEEYLVVRISEREVADMLHGNISMRQVILNQKKYWDVKAGEGITDDEVTECDIETIPLEVLPYKDACYEVVSEDVQSYLEKLESNLEISVTIEYKESWRMILEGYSALIQNITLALQEVVQEALSVDDWKKECNFDVSFDLNKGKNEKLVVNENEMMNLAA